MHKVVCIETNLKLHHHVVKAVVSATSHKATHMVFTWEIKGGQESFRLLSEEKMRSFYSHLTSAASFDRKMLHESCECSYFPALYSSLPSMTALLIYRLWHTHRVYTCAWTALCVCVCVRANVLWSLRTLLHWQIDCGHTPNPSARSEYEKPPC